MKSLKRLCIVSWCLLCLSMGVRPHTGHAAGGVFAFVGTGGPIESTLTVAPPVPIVVAPVVVTLAGIWSDACIPSYESHSITAHTVIIVVETPAPEVVCGQAETPWSLTVGLGHLAAATYQLQVVGALTMSIDITVFSNLSYLPLVSGT